MMIFKLFDRLLLQQAGKQMNTWHMLLMLLFGHETPLALPLVLSLWLLLLLLGLRSCTSGSCGAGYAAIVIAKQAASCCMDHPFADCLPHRQHDAVQLQHIQDISTAFNSLLCWLGLLNTFQSQSESDAKFFSEL